MASSLAPGLRRRKIPWQRPRRNRPRVRRRARLHRQQKRSRPSAKQRQKLPRSAFRTKRLHALRTSIGRNGADSTATTLQIGCARSRNYAARHPKRDFRQGAVRLFPFFFLLLAYVRYPALADCPANFALHGPAVKWSVVRFGTSVPGVIRPFGFGIEDHHVGEAADCQ